VSYETWRRRFSGRESAIGEQVLLGGVPRTIIGVLPPGFRFEPAERRGGADPIEYWVPLPLVAQGQAAITTYYLEALAKLKAGVTVERARADLASITKGVTSGESSSDVASLQKELTHTSRRTLLFLLAAVALVLLVACTNLAHLQLARAAARGREIAIRRALGAGRMRLIRHFMTESILIAMLGGSLGLAGAWASLGPLVRFAGQDLPKADQVRIDMFVLSFTAFAAVLSAVFGLMPALRMSSDGARADLQSRDTTRSSPASSRLTRVLLAGEIGLALVLVACASLMLTSLWRVENVPPGFSTTHLLTMRTVLPYARYKGQNGVRFYAETIDALTRLPGVEAADAANTLPMGGSTPFQGFVVEGTGRADAPAAERNRGQFRSVTPGYFRTLGIPLMRGRAFTDSDRDAAPLVAIVNQTAERRYFNNNAVGRRIFSGQGNDPIEVIGVVGDVRHASARSDPLPEVYYPLAQNPGVRMWLVVRTSRDPLSIAEEVRKSIASRDPSVVVDHLQTMVERRAASLGVSEFLAYLLIGFAGLALLLAVIGDYSVVAYSVVRRTPEIGLRLAVGATRGAVVAMVMRDTLIAALGGVALAIPVALGAARLLSGYLFDVAPGDPRIFAAAGAMMLLVAMAAALPPAWRASRLDPVMALRNE
jgi:putative ABC transport system permease protein